MTAILQHTVTKQGVTFRLVDSASEPIPLDNWGSFTVTTGHGQGSVGCLLGLMVDEKTHSSDNVSIQVAHGEIAALDPVRLTQLGLPAAAPHRLELRGSGLLSAPGFSFEYRLITPSGRPAIGVQRTGVQLKAGNNLYTLLDPLYSLLTDLESFNNTPPENLDQRFMIWAELKKLLPADAVVDDHLRNMHIVRADSFTIDFDDKEQVNPVLLATADHSEPSVHSSDWTTREILTPIAQRSMFSRFAALSDVQARYVLEGGWYVVLSKPIRQALEVVKEYQGRKVEERRALLDNPVGILKERLVGQLTDEQIEAIFEETPAFLSARVQGLGEWNPKLCAYMLPGTQKWLPPESALLNLPLQDQVFSIPSHELPELAKKMHTALAAGDSEITFADQTFPVTPESCDTITTLVHKAEKLTKTHTPEDDKSRTLDLVPQIIDNLDNLGFSVEPRPTRGSIGGLPANLESSLYKHQRVGLQWLQEHWVKGNSGALLADDMGLGKTLQALAFMAWVQEQKEKEPLTPKPFLIVAPTGLLKNWEDEAMQHFAAPGLGELTRAYGGGLRDLMAETQREQIKKINHTDWVLTTYETLRDRIKLFIGVDWGLVVFDEAQKIKNPTARVAEMAKSLQADFTLALTGTPVENRLSDLWSIVDTTNPGLLGALKKFHDDFEKPAQSDPTAAAPLAHKIMEEQKPSIMLRRLKEDHLEGLPVKKQWLLTEEMPPQQAQAYEEIVASAATADMSKGAMLEILHALRKVSVLAVPLGAAGMTDEIVYSSARLRAMINVMDELFAKNEKLLVFVEFLDLQESLIPYLQQRYLLPKPPLRISGKVSGAKRKSLVDSFQQSRSNLFDVMLLSPKAGGVGLTLTAANNVIHLTRWWNPAVEDQCTDRVYRIGQNKPVNVYLPLAIHPRFNEHSFDQNLHLLLERKRKLSRSVLTPPAMDDSDLAGLFSHSVGK